MIRRPSARTLFALALIAFAGRAAAAALSPPGFNLRWDQCYADGGATNRTFACDTNTGSDRLAMSFELASPLSQVSGVEFTLVIGADLPTLPAWWGFKNAGTCRQSAMSLAASPPPGSVNCVDWSAGLAAGGIGAYNIGYAGPWTARIVGVVAVSASLPDLAAGVEYGFGTLTINRTKTVGTGACGGCATPVCLMFSTVTIDHLLAGGVTVESVLLTRAANWFGSGLVGWQNGYIADYYPYGHNSVGVPFDAQINRCVPYSTTRARSTTWGAVKSLYR